MCIIGKNKPYSNQIKIINIFYPCMGILKFQIVDEALCFCLIRVDWDLGLLIMDVCLIKGIGRNWNSDYTFQKWSLF